MYREVTPGARLRDYVECFWTREVRAGTPAGVAEHRILPDGCIDLIFEFTPRGLAGASAVGTMTRALRVPAIPHRAMLGVRFHPGGASALLGREASALTDLRVALRDAAPSLPPDAEEALDAAENSGRVATLSAVLERLLPRARPVDALVAAAAAHIRCADGRVRVERLGVAFGVTRQHLARAFAKHVGVSPKTFARVARVQGVVRRARRAARPEWSRLACDMGYADQSHLCGEFREIVGLTPSGWAALR